MESYLFADVEAAADTMVVEGYHKPGSLTRSSGAWIHAAGTSVSSCPCQTSVVSESGDV